MPVRFKLKNNADLSAHQNLKKFDGAHAKLMAMLLQCKEGASCSRKTIGSELIT